MPGRSANGKKLSDKFVLVLDPTCETSLRRFHLLRKLRCDVPLLLRILKQIIDLMRIPGGVENILSIAVTVTKQVVRPRCKKIGPRRTVFVEKRAALPARGWRVSQEIHDGRRHVNQPPDRSSLLALEH